MKQFPLPLRSENLPIPQAQVRPRVAAPARLSPETVLLVDVDGELPNLALMKLSQHFKAQGRPVVLTKGVQRLPHAQTVLASAVFSTPGTARRIEILRDRYGESLELGGSGVDIYKRLAPEIESLKPDFTLYPELGERALGFLTRGCPCHCSFCIVPAKEAPLAA